MFKAILWDNDGVLVDSESIFFQATQNVLQNVGITFTRDEFIEISLNAGRNEFDVVKQYGVTNEQIETLRRRRNEAYSDLLRRGIELNSEVEEIIRALAQSYRMGIVTSSWRTHFDIVYEGKDVLSCFEAIITRDDCRFTKPHPEPYLLALAKLGIGASEALAIEDCERGLRAAKRAGIACCVIPTEITRSGDFSSADHILKSVKDLPRFLRRKGVP